MTADDLARLFHDTYERLAPDYQYETRKASAVPWDDVPEPNRSLMVAVAGEVLAVIGDRVEAANTERDRLAAENEGLAEARATFREGYGLACADRDRLAAQVDTLNTAARELCDALDRDCGTATVPVERRALRAVLAAVDRPDTEGAPAR